MRRQYAFRAFAAGLFASGALLLCCTTGVVGTAVQSNAVSTADAGARDAGACPRDCQAIGEICHPQRLICVECLNDAECAIVGARFCDRGECTECRTHADCSSRATPWCGFGHCSVCPDARYRDGMCDFDPHCSGRDCDDGAPGQRSGRFGADPDDHEIERSPPDAGP